MILHTLTTIVAFMIMISSSFVQTVKASQADDRMKERYTQVIHKPENDTIKPKENYKTINVECTFYTSLSVCNGDSNCLTASGEYLNSKTIAVPRQDGSTNPIYPFGTKVEIKGYGEKLVQDTGNPKYLKIKDDGTVIVDIFIPKESNESNSQYLQRVRNMGRVQTTAKVYLK